MSDCHVKRLELRMRKYEDIIILIVFTLGLRKYVLHIIYHKARYHTKGHFQTEHRNSKSKVEPEFLHGCVIFSITKEILVQKAPFLCKNMLVMSECQNRKKRVRQNKNCTFVNDTAKKRQHLWLGKSDTGMIQRYFTGVSN